MWEKFASVMKALLATLQGFSAFMQVCLCNCIIPLLMWSLCVCLYVPACLPAVFGMLVCIRLPAVVELLVLLAVDPEWSV